MERTTAAIRLDRNEMNALRWYAKAYGFSVSELMRELIRDGLEGLNEYRLKGGIYIMAGEDEELTKEYERAVKTGDWERVSEIGKRLADRGAMIVRSRSLPRMTLSLDLDTYKKAKARARENGQSLTEYLSGLARDFLKYAGRLHEETMGKPDERLRLLTTEAKP